MNGGGDVHEGTVIEWKGTFGFINVADGRRAYVHNSQTGGEALAAGQTVHACIIEDPRNPGKWQAQSVIASSAAAPPALVLTTTGQIQGVVTDWKGSHGFIEFTDGRRAYAHRSQCDQCGGGLYVGQSVAATMVDDPRNPGKWQAMEIVDVSGGGTSTSSAAVGGSRAQGTVTEWTGTYGFISFADGSRAYVHNSQCAACGGAVYQGQEVAATVVEDPRNPGKWQAMDVSDASGAATQWTAGGTAASWNGGGAAVGPKIQGVVTEWTGTYGFVEFSDHRRAYVHNSQCAAVGGTLSLGQHVACRAVEDPRNPGKWQAVDVSPVGGASRAIGARPIGAPIGGVPRRVAPGLGAARSGTPAGTLEGVVSQWNAGQTFGFINFNDGRRAYVHTSQTGGVSFTEGQPVIGYLTEDPKNPGKWQAMSVQVSAGGSAMGSGIGSSIGSAVGAAVGPGMVSGTVSQWNVGGYGFVDLVDGRRAYVHACECPGGEHLVCGETVSAYVSPDPQNPGKWCCQGVVRGAAQRSAAPAVRVHSAAVSQAQGSGIASGTVTQWNPKGFGFITLEDGTKAYVHASQCPDGEHLFEGEVVQATIVPDAANPGKWAAMDVQKLGNGRSTAEDPAAKRARLGGNAGGVRYSI